MYTDDDYTDFKKVAGNHIAEMCKRLYIFWLTKLALEPPKSDPEWSPKPGVCAFSDAPPGARYDAEYMPFGNPTENDSGRSFDDSGPHVNPSPVNTPVRPLVPGSLPVSRDQDQPVTDAFGLLVPPLMPNSGKSNNSVNVRVAAGRDLPPMDGHGSKDGEMLAPPLMSAKTEEPIAPPLMGQSSLSPPAMNIDQESLENPGSGNKVGSLSLPAYPSPNEGGLETHANNNSGNKDQPPYPVPEMGSMDAPPFPPALLRFLNNNGHLVNAQGTIAPPTPDMRTPPPPKELNWT